MWLSSVWASASHRKLSVVWRTSSRSDLQLVNYQSSPRWAHSALQLPHLDNHRLSIERQAGLRGLIERVKFIKFQLCNVCSRAEFWQCLHNLMLERTVWYYNYRRAAWQYRDILFTLGHTITKHSPYIDFVYTSRCNEIKNILLALCHQRAVSYASPQPFRVGPLCGFEEGVYGLLIIFENCWRIFSLARMRNVLPDLTTSCLSI